MTTETGEEETRDRREDILSPGQTVCGNYTVRSCLGSGGMAQVFEAFDSRLNRLVALKVAWPEMDSSLLVQEARTLAAFRHPGFITVHELEETEREGHVIIMERVLGQQLTELIKRQPQGLPIPEALEIGLQIGSTLAILHRAGMVYRDVKPDNVMMAPGGRVVLMDFGIARTESQLARESMVAGSPHYMAPETGTGDVETGQGHLIDLYALGVILFEMLTGARPYDGDTAVEIVVHQMNSPVPRVSRLRSEVSPEVDNLVFALMAKEPDERPGYIGPVLAQLRSQLFQSGSSKTQRPFSVLIADDDSITRRVVVEIVSKIDPDATIRQAQDGEEALALLQQAAPDLLLLDLEMPAMNGLEVLMFLQGTSRYEGTTIAVITGAGPTEEALVRSLGAATFIRKHQTPMSVLTTRVSRVIERAQRAKAARAPRTRRS